MSIINAQVSCLLAAQSQYQLKSKPPKKHTISNAQSWLINLALDCRYLNAKNEGDVIQLLVAVANDEIPLTAKLDEYLRSFLPLKHLNIIVDYLNQVQISEGGVVRGLTKEEKIEMVYLVLGIIHTESGFVPQLQTYPKYEENTARGLMQLKMEAARVYNKDVTAEELFSPYTNIRAGIRYMAKLAGLLYDYYYSLGYPTYNVDRFTYMVVAFHDGQKGGAKKVQDYPTYGSLIENDIYAQAVFAKADVYRMLYSDQIEALFPEGK